MRDGIVIVLVAGIALLVYLAATQSSVASRSQQPFSGPFGPLVIWN